MDWQFEGPGSTLDHRAKFPSQACPAHSAVRSTLEIHSVEGKTERERLANALYEH